VFAVPRLAITVLVERNVYTSTRKFGTDSRRISQAMLVLVTHVNCSVSAVLQSVARFGSSSCHVAHLKTTSPHSCSDCSSSRFVTHAKFGPLIVHITVNQRCDSALRRAVSNSHSRNIISRPVFLISQVLNLIFSPYFLIRVMFNDYASVCMFIYNQGPHRAVPVHTLSFLQIMEHLIRNQRE
jgi:hypothetical protein